MTHRSRRSVLRKLATGSLVALAAVLTTFDASAGGTNTAPCREGKARGIWDLPDSGRTGSVQGALFGRSGNRVFRMKGELIPGPSLNPRGTMRGELDNGGRAYPRWTFSGTYEGTLLGSGRWSAQVAMQVSPLGPLRLVGKMEGTYSDPPISTRPTGSFEGRWEICR